MKNRYFYFWAISFAKKHRIYETLNYPLEYFKRFSLSILQNVKSQRTSPTLLIFNPDQYLFYRHNFTKSLCKHPLGRGGQHILVLHELADRRAGPGVSSSTPQCLEGCWPSKKGYQRPQQHFREERLWHPPPRTLLGSVSCKLLTISPFVD